MVSEIQMVEKVVRHHYRRYWIFDEELVDSRTAFEKEHNALCAFLFYLQEKTNINRLRYFDANDSKAETIISFLDFDILRIQEYNWYSREKQATCVTLSAIEDVSP